MYSSFWYLRSRLNFEEEINRFSITRILLIPRVGPTPIGQTTLDAFYIFFRGVPQSIQRIAGKSLPIEKFAMKKALRYFDQGKRLTLPGIVS